MVMVAVAATYGCRYGCGYGYNYGYGYGYGYGSRTAPKVTQTLGRISLLFFSETGIRERCSSESRDLDRMCVYEKISTRDASMERKISTRYASMERSRRYIVSAMISRCFYGTPLGLGQLSSGGCVDCVYAVWLRLHLRLRLPLPVPLRPRLRLLLRLRVPLRRRLRFRFRGTVTVAAVVTVTVMVTNMVARCCCGYGLPVTFGRDYGCGSGYGYRCGAGYGCSFGYQRSRLSVYGFDYGLWLLALLSRVWLRLYRNTVTVAVTVVFSPPVFFSQL